ncbi:MAG: Mpo1-like protein [Pseudomonas sp.]
MARHRPNLLTWQWRRYAAAHRNPTNLIVHLIAVPLFILASAVLLSALFQLDVLQLVLGVIGLLAALALQAHGHRLEAKVQEPFSDTTDAVQRLLLEQFFTFPRFVLNGGWWRAWKTRQRH